MVTVDGLFARRWRSVYHLALVQGAVVVLLRLLVGFDNVWFARASGAAYLLLVLADMAVCLGPAAWREAAAAGLRRVLRAAGIGCFL